MKCFSRVHEDSSQLVVVVLSICKDGSWCKFFLQNQFASRLYLSLYNIINLLSSIYAGLPITLKSIKVIFFLSDSEKCLDGRESNPELVDQLARMPPLCHATSWLVQSLVNMYKMLLFVMVPRSSLERLQPNFRQLSHWPGLKNVRILAPYTLKHIGSCKKRQNCSMKDKCLGYSTSMQDA